MVSRGKNPQHCAARVKLRTMKDGSTFVRSKDVSCTIEFVIITNARLSSGTSSREGGAGLPSLQTTAEKCSTN